MADADPTVLSTPSPFTINDRLRRRVTDAVIAQGGIRHEALNAFLRDHLAGSSVDGGALLSELAVEGAAGFLSSGRTLADLRGTLLNGRLVDALATGAPEYRFDYPAYTHQVEAWEHLRALDPRSVLVSSGTGSGKTECFLVPLLDDLAREAERVGRLRGVRALMLYPLNALIASQQERLTRWTAPFGGDVRFALYNGLMTDKREGDRARDEAQCPEQVLYRRTLRSDPPPILVTNNTMLEYMTIRKEDAPIVEASQGLLRWIVIDEAHSYVGSAAAEVSLLLRRVLQTFGVRAADVRFVATSATIGASDERGRADLARYLADLAGVDLGQVRVVFGAREPVRLPSVGSAGPLRAGVSVAANPTIQALVRSLEERPLSLKQIDARARECASSAAEVLEAVGDPLPTGRAVLPLRVHQFIRAVPGLWSCLNPACIGDKPVDWPYGGIAWERDDACSRCASPLLEIVSCRQCGEPWLDAFDHGDRITGRSTPPDRDEFAAASARETDADDGEGDVEGDELPASSPRRADGQRRLLGTRPVECLLRCEIEPLDGTFPEERGRGTPILMSRSADDGCCPRCHAAPSATGGKPLWPFRFGAPFLIQNATPTMLEGVSPNGERPSSHLPAGGRQLLSFTDSRQGTARFAANVETMSERGFVRSFIYHMVQKVGAPRVLATEERETLEKRRAAFATLAATDNAFAADLARVEAELGGGAATATVPWNDAVRALAIEPMLKEGIGKVWDADRDQRYQDHPEALANYLMLRELARRPARSNAVETLGLAKLVFPQIEKLGEASLPSKMRRMERTIVEWREFLYFMLDTVVRGNFALSIAQEDARWLLPRDAYLHTLIGPNREKQQSSDLRWPSAPKGAGARSNAVLAFERFLRLDSAEPEDRAEMDDLLSAAWDHLRPLFEGSGSAYALDLRRAEIAPVREAWTCPVTFRVLPRLLFGRSPNGLRGRPPGADVPPSPLVMPWLSHVFPITDVERVIVAEWVRTDPEIAVLRDRGAWGDLHERAATFAPYIRAEEHSAQQPPHRLRAFEAQFKRGEINLLACSTTMEMGVDIGSVESVLNTNVPPSIANYRQRVGRAGRRGQSFATSLTFARDTPLDREAFRDPVRYLGRSLRAPRVTLESKRIVQRHVNALLLARWFREAKGELARVKAGAFYGYPLSLAETTQTDPPVARLIAWLRNPSTAAAVAPALGALTRGTALAADGGVVSTAALAFEKASKAFGSQWQALRDQADFVTIDARAGIERQLRRMGKESLLSELANRSVLPGHGFPTAVVPFVTECAETSNRRIRDEDGGETSRNRRYDYPSRNADVAIREYAPGAQVVVDGLVWTSAGVQLNWQRPTEGEGGDRIQSIRWAWNCAECGEAGCDALMPESCSACGAGALERTQFLEPAGFRVEWRSKPHADTNTVNYVEPRPARISAREARWEPMLDPALGRARATADGLVFYHSMGAGKAGYRICLDCGRAEEDGDAALAEHDALMPPKGGVGRCAGNDKTYAKTRPLALGHEVLTDVAELQPVALDDIGAAWALASAVREALSRRLGIEPRELGLGVALRTGAMSEPTHSIFLYDQSSGGAGYAPRLLADLLGVLKDAAGILACPVDCVRGCSACVLVADLFQYQEVIDRRAALAFVTALLGGMAEPQTEDVAGPACRLSPPAADVIARRVERGNVVSLWVGEEVEIGALAQPPLATLFAAIGATGGEARLVLPETQMEALDDSARAGLRNASHRHGFTLWTGNAAVAENGAVLVATLQQGSSTVGFLSRDADATRIGLGWGSGIEHPLVEMPFSVPPMRRVLDELLEHSAKPGDRVRMISSDAGRSQRQFGTGLVGAVLRPELEAAGLWRPGRLIGLAYSDRYLKGPLPVLLLMRTAAALRDALAPKGSIIPISIITEPLRLDRQAGSPMRLHHDWRDEDDRAETVEALAERLGFAPEYLDTQAPHGRKLTIRYDDGDCAVLLFDQGFGYWRAGSGDRHDFRSGPITQAKAMLDGSAFVSGHGESYVAVTRSSA